MPDQATIIRWEAPPPPRGRTACAGRQGSRYDPVARDLIANPGRPAVIYDGPLRHQADSLALRIRRGQIISFPAGDFHAVVRAVSGRHCVYAWYVGPGGAA